MEEKSAILASKFTSIVLRVFHSIFFSIFVLFFKKHTITDSMWGESPENKIIPTQKICNSNTNLFFLINGKNRMYYLLTIYIFFFFNFYDSRIAFIITYSS